MDKNLTVPDIWRQQACEAACKNSSTEWLYAYGSQENAKPLQEVVNDLLRVKLSAKAAIRSARPVLINDRQLEVIAVDVAAWQEMMDVINSIR